MLRSVRFILTFTGLVAAGWFVPADMAVAQAKKKLTIPKPEQLSFDSLGTTIHFMYFPGGFIHKEGEVARSVSKEMPKPAPKDLTKPLAKEPAKPVSKEPAKPAAKSDSDIETIPGKEVVPVVLLHGYEGRGADLYPLALMLQRMGHAVVVPDLRGHGSSRYRSQGKGEEVPPDKLSRADFNAMVGDLEILKKFLYEKNNQGELNVEQLCLVGADLGGLVAANWIAMDWSRQDLPAFRQGKSVKALVYLSPVGSVKGYSASAAWKHPVFQTGAYMSIMLVSGERDGKSRSETRQIYNRLEKSHQTGAGPGDRARMSLWLVEPDTELSGTKLVHPAARLNVSLQIAQFIAFRLGARQAEFPWSERRSPLDIQK
jgi:alpha-beta hydrolase superfamily lysophospholipase